MQRIRRPAPTLLAALALVAAACGGDASDGADGTLLVFAAASLTDAFSDIETAFEEVNPGLDVTFNFAGSSSLREQILEGAPADVFASANGTNMSTVADAGALAGEATVFARNLLQIAVPAGNPGGVTGLADLGDPDLLIGLCAEGVPCGDFGRTALADAGVVPEIDTNEPDVRSLLTKIEADELDAGIVYVTDVLAAGARVEGIDIPEDVNVVAAYPIAALAEAPNPDAATAFVAFVMSPAGQAILAGYGFAAP